MDVYEAALNYRDCGLSLVPVRTDGTKAAATKWTELQARMPTDVELRAWFCRAQPYGIGIVGGTISGNLERLDFDEVGLYDNWADLCREQSLDDILKALVVVRTPSGGSHVYYRCGSEIPGNKVLARRKTADAPTKLVTLAETRGEGGYTIAPGSPVSCHPTALPYELTQGAFEKTPVLSETERAYLVNLVEVFNEHLDPACIAPEPNTRRPVSGGLRPGDDYNARGDYYPIIERDGWTRCGGRGECLFWRRPGKADRGISATSNYAGSEKFYVFSSNASPFEPNRAYSPFAVKAFLEHSGDFTTAARDLASQGYGPARNNGVSNEEPPLALVCKRERVSIAERIIDASTMVKPEGEQPTLCGPYILPGASHLLVGTRGIGKSTLAFGMAATIAMGTEWYGLECTQVNVLYIDTENGERLRSEKLHRLFKDGFPSEGRLYFLDGSCKMEADSNGLIEFAMKNNIRLVIFDTLRRCFAVKDENDNAEFYARVAPILDALKEAGIASLLLAHPAKGTGKSARGAGAQEDAVDIVLSVGMRNNGSVTDELGVIELSSMKNRILGLTVPPLLLRRAGNDQFSLLSAGELTVAADTVRESTKQEQCEAAIAEYLEYIHPDRATYTDLLKAMQEKAFSNSTFKNALASLKETGALAQTETGYQVNHRAMGEHED